MCGIAGILSFSERNIEESRIKAMNHALMHRGPDDGGVYLDANIGLGHRRLSIIDLSKLAHQPMQSYNGRYVISYNGELYNYKTLRINLENLGHKFKSRSDTEVVLNSFLEWGVNCLQKFNGMFAFAVWDTVNKTLFIARDRYGIKPLYYYKNSDFFIFASEIKAIVASELYQTQLDKEGLLEYLTFQNFITHKTLFKDVNMLMPGHYAWVNSKGTVNLNQYWDFDFVNNKVNISEQEAIDETDRLFAQAVNRQLISDVPVNSYLSGGIDSASITMLASKQLVDMKTFTIGFDLSSASGLELAFDERVKAEHISYLAGTEHYEMVLKAGDMERCMKQYAWHLEEPRVGQSYPNFYAAKLASKFGKVVLSGAGGDELFAGYPWRYIYDHNFSEDTTFTDFTDFYYLKWQRLIPNKLLMQLLKPIWGDLNGLQTKDLFANVFKQEYKDNFDINNCFEYSLYFEAKTFLHGLLTVEDKLSMAYSLESRVPFLDNDLVDFALQLPRHLKVKNSSLSVNENDLASKKYNRTRNGKYILRKSLEKHLDDFIVNNEKQGFSSPDASWFRGESLDFVRRTLNDSVLVKNNLFDADVLQAYINSHLEGSENRRLFIWSFLNLEAILASFFFQKQSQNSLLEEMASNIY